MTAVDIAVAPRAHRGIDRGTEKKAAPSAFVEALNRKRRGRQRPGAARSSGSKTSTAPPRPRRASGPSYAKAARLRPRMWTGGPGAPPPQASARHKLHSKRFGNNMSKCRRLPLRRHLEATAQEETTPQKIHVATASVDEPAAEEPLAKKPRLCCVSGDRERAPGSSAAATTSFLSSELLRRRYGGGGRRAVLGLPPRKSVTFADPLVSSVRTRPRTSRAGLSRLFYDRSDEARFRRDERARRGLAEPCGADSGDDGGGDTDTEDEDEEVVAVVVVARTRKAQDEPLPIGGGTDGNPNEVTESDDSGGGSSDEYTDDSDS